MADTLSGVLRRPFDEQVAAFRARLGDLVPTERWDELQGEAQDRAFVVAGAVKADLLADLAASVDRAIVEGTDIEAFRKDFRAIVARHGWSGWTGEESERGTRWRTRVIYQTNMRTSMAAGRHAQLKEAGFRFWVYRHSGAAHPRLDHLSWDGLALEADHPFWATHYPPNGWGCGCKVRGANTRAGIRRVGGDPDKALPDGWDAIDPNTGTPEGVGKGWDYAPGAGVAADIQAATRKLVGWPYQVGKAYMQELPQDRADAVSESLRSLPSLADDIRRYAERVIGERGGGPVEGPVEIQPYRTMGLVTSGQRARIGEILGVELGGFDWTLSPAAVAHVRRKHGDHAAERKRGQDGIEASDFALLPRLISDPDEIRQTKRGSVEMSKVIGGRKLTAIFDVAARRKMVRLVTMWIKSAP